MLGSALAAVVEEDRLGSMVTFFLIALVLVSPFGFRLYRRTVRERRALEAGDPLTGGDGDADGDAGDEPLIDRADLGLVVAAITAAGADLGPGEAVELVVAGDSTLDGRPAPIAVVDAVLFDAARRSGLVASWLPDDGTDRRLRLVAP